MENNIDIEDIINKFKKTKYHLSEYHVRNALSWVNKRPNNNIAYLYKTNCIINNKTIKEIYKKLIFEDDNAEVKGFWINNNNKPFLIWGKKKDFNYVKNIQR